MWYNLTQNKASIFYNIDSGGLLKMGTPGIGDPYWYEWYVGLKNVIDMLNPDSRIVSVTFQHGEFDTIDDVVVEFADSGSQICYQIKHEILTSKESNLTFGKLLEKEENKNSLISAIFSGWQNASKGAHSTIAPKLYTNRNIGKNKTTRDFNGTSYTAYPLDIFLISIKKVLQDVSDTENINIEDNNLKLQWEELCRNINSDKTSIAEFLKIFTVESSQPELEDLEENLIKSLAASFSCSENTIKGGSKNLIKSPQLKNIGLIKFYRPNILVESILDKHKRTEKITVKEILI